MVLFHGTSKRWAEDILRNHVDLSLCSVYSDFGRGFYTTDDAEFAYRCGRRRLWGEDDTVSILKFDFDMEAAKALIRCFDDYTIS